MANKKITRRALVMSVISLVLCCAMLVGTTFAWFTDEVTSAGNIIKSGTLEVTMDWADGKEAPASATWTDASTGAIFNYELWEPGYTVVRHIKISNVGTLALKYQLKILANGAVSDLSDVIDVYYADPAVQVDERTDLTAAMKLGTLTEALAGMSQTASGSLAAGDTVTLTLALKMQESAGNDYQDKSIGSDFSVQLLATQDTVEADSFGTDYDGSSIYVEKPMNVSGTTKVDTTGATTSYDIALINEDGGKNGSAVVPAAAVAGDVTDINVYVKETSLNTEVPVAANQDAKTYDVKVEGLKAGNTEKVKITLNIPTGLTGVEVYHNNVKIESVYNPNDGTLIFESASFSPYTVVYDAVPVEKDEEDLDKKVPVAVVTDADEFENVALEWTGSGGYNTASSTQQLNSVYKFVSPDTSESVEESQYRYWCCDYYVKLVPAEGSTMTKLPEGSISLGGNYGGYGWVGFDNPEVDVNTFIPLLGSVLGNCDEEGTTVDTSWTYEAVVDLVQEFWCGVAVADDKSDDVDLDGAKFVVELRLTNPENFDEYIAVNTVTYTFGTGESVIESYKG